MNNTAEIERINTYIQRTGVKNTSRWEFVLTEYTAVLQMIREGKELEALTLIFNYGRAKGYRMARRVSYAKQ